MGTGRPEHNFVIFRDATFGARVHLSDGDSLLRPGSPPNRNLFESPGSPPSGAFFCLGRLFLTRSWPRLIAAFGTNSIPSRHVARAYGRHAPDHAHDQIEVPPVVGVDQQTRAGRHPSASRSDRPGAAPWLHLIPSSVFAAELWLLRPPIPETAGQQRLPVLSLPIGISHGPTLGPFSKSPFGRRTWTMVKKRFRRRYRPPCAGPRRDQ